MYLAEDPDGRQVALKVMLPELAQEARFRERFLREADRRRGIGATDGSVNGGGNRASGDATSPQCRNVVCSG